MKLPFSCPLKSRITGHVELTLRPLTHPAGRQGWSTCMMYLVLGRGSGTDRGLPVIKEKGVQKSRDTVAQLVHKHGPMITPALVPWGGSFQGIGWTQALEVMKGM